MTRRELMRLEDKVLDRVIKIQGTQYDRKRKLTDKQIQKANILYTQYDASFWDLAVMFGVDVRTIRYNLQSSYRARRLEYAKTHPQKRKSVIADPCAVFMERVAYKRKLVARRKVFA